MMKVQQNMNYQNIQNCIIKYPVIIVIHVVCRKCTLRKILFLTHDVAQ